MLQWCCSDLQWQQVRITVELVAFGGCPCISGFHVFHLFDQITLLTPHRLQSRFLVLCLKLKNCLPKDQITSQTTQVFNKTVQILSSSVHTGILQFPLKHLEDELSEAKIHSVLFLELIRTQGTSASLFFHPSFISHKGS